MTHKNLILSRKNRKSILWDAFYNANGIQKPLVVFCHGYKGFKDWGAWDLVAKAFSDANLFFVKFNFSHNGGTIENPIDFPDLNSFAENNYSKELEDLDDMINFLVSKENPFNSEIKTNHIILIGHSRGGGIVTIKASEDHKISQLITWASVSNFETRMGTKSEIDTWKNDGVKYVLNGRTNQQMPHYYQFYEDFKANEKRLQIEKAAKNLHIPHLVIHAKDDTSVNYYEAEALCEWNPKSEIFPIENSDHVFGTSHPWTQNVLSKDLNEVIKKSIHFIESHLQQQLSQQ